MSFQLLPKSVTLNDPEQRNGRVVCVISPNLVDFGAYYLIELFSLGFTAEELRTNIGWKSAISLQWGSVDPKFHVERVAPTNHSFSQKTRINDFSYDIKILPKISIAWVGCTNVTDDRQTDDEQTDRRQTDGRRHIANVNTFAKKWLKIHRYILRVKCSQKNLVFNDISLMAIFAENHLQRGR